MKRSLVHVFSPRTARCKRRRSCCCCAQRRRCQLFSQGACEREMDVHMPGIVVLGNEEIKRILPKNKDHSFSAIRRHLYPSKTIRSGASGYLTAKGTNTSELLGSGIQMWRKASIIFPKNGWRKWRCPSFPSMGKVRHWAVGQIESYKWAQMIVELVKIQ